MLQVASHPSSFVPSYHRQDPSQPQSALQLPRVLSRPPFTEVSKEAIIAASPELGSVPVEYIRQSLRSQAPVLLAGLAALAPYIPSSLPRSDLPSCFSAPLHSSNSPTGPSLPTHVLAITSSETKTNDVAIFPIHAVVLASQCARLPRLPPANTSSAYTLKLPVLQLSLPSPVAFSILHTYMYTHRLDRVLKALFPMPVSFLDSLSHETVQATLASGSALQELSSFLRSSASSNLQILMNHAAHVKQLWQDMVALGLYTSELWDALDLAWEVLLGSLCHLASATSPSPSTAIEHRKKRISSTPGPDAVIHRTPVTPLAPSPSTVIERQEASAMQPDIYLQGCSEINTSMPTQADAMFPKQTLPTFSDEALVTLNTTALSGDGVLPVTHVLLRAEDAARHVSQYSADVESILAAHGVRHGHYHIQVGFNTTLIKHGVGYLQEIYVSLDEEIPSGALDKLGKVLSPFLTHVQTPFTSARAPVYKMDGTIWIVDDLILHRIVKFGDVTPLTTALTYTNCTFQGSGASVPMQGGSNSGNASDDTGRGDRGGEGQESGAGGSGRSGDGPNLPDENFGTTLDENTRKHTRPAAYFDLSTDIYGKYPASSVQNIRVTGSVICEVKSLANRDLDTFSTSHVELLKLKFQGKPNIESCYMQYYARVAVDTGHSFTNTTVIRPSSTSAGDGERTETVGSKTTWTGSLEGLCSATIGLMGMRSSSFTASVKATGSRATEASLTSTSKKYNSRITQRDGDGVIWWGFDVDDRYHQESGLELRGEFLPSVDFEFLGEDFPPPPDCHGIEIASYWSLPKVLPYDIQEILKQPLYANLAQVIKLDMPGHLPRRSNYKGIFDVGHVSPSGPSGVTSPGLINVVPLVSTVDNPDSVSNQHENGLWYQKSLLKLAPPSRSPPLDDPGDSFLEQDSAITTASASSSKPETTIEARQLDNANADSDSPTIQKLSHGRPLTHDGLENHGQLSAKAKGKQRAQDATGPD